MLLNRIEKAQTAFNCIRCKSRLLGLFNRRVRIALVHAIAVSNLLYGSVIFGCLGPARVALSGGSMAFQRAEVLMRKMLRWAVRCCTIDTRCSFLYAVTNSTNLQVLC